MISIIKEVTQLLVSDGNYNLKLHSNEAWPIVTERLRSLDRMVCVHLRRRHSYRLFTLRYRAHNFRERRRRLHAPVLFYSHAARVRHNQGLVCPFQKIIRPFNFLRSAVSHIQAGREVGVTGCARSGESAIFE